MPGLGWFYLVRGPPDAARDVGARLLDHGGGDAAIRRSSSPRHNTLGVASFYGGEFEAALAPSRARRSSSTIRQAHSPTRSPAFRHTSTGRVVPVHAAWALWVLGYPARAAARMREALELAHSIEHPFSVGPRPSLRRAFHVSLGESARRSRNRQSGGGPVDRAWLRRRPLVGELPPGWACAETGGKRTASRRCARGSPLPGDPAGMLASPLPGVAGRDVCELGRPAEDGEGSRGRRHWPPATESGELTTGRPSLHRVRRTTLRAVRGRMPSRLSSRRSRSRGDSARSRSSSARRRLEPALGAPGEDAGSSRAACGGLRLVHRRV